MIGGGNVEPANSIILVLNLLADLAESPTSELASASKPEVMKLHNAMNSLNIASRRSMLGSSNWETTLRLVSPKHDVIYHTWFLQTGALLGEDVAVLNQRPTELYAEQQARKARFVQPGDTLAIHIPGLLPRSGNPPVLQAGKANPVVGFPVPVSPAGTIELPMIDPLTVKDRELKQVKNAIEQAYMVDQKILRDDVQHTITVQFLLREGHPVEIRNITGSTVAAPSKEQ